MLSSGTSASADDFAGGAAPGSQYGQTQYGQDKQIQYGQTQMTPTEPAANSQVAESNSERSKRDVINIFNGEPFYERSDQWGLRGETPWPGPMAGGGFTYSPKNGVNANLYGGAKVGGNLNVVNGSLGKAYAGVGYSTQLGPNFQAGAEFHPEVNIKAPIGDTKKGGKGALFGVDGGSSSITTATGTNGQQVDVASQHGLHVSVPTKSFPVGPQTASSHVRYKNNYRTIEVTHLDPETGQMVPGAG